MQARQKAEEKKAASKKTAPVEEAPVEEAKLWKSDFHSFVLRGIINKDEKRTIYS